MPTGVTGSKALRHHLPVPKVLSKTVNFNDTGIATGISFGTIPKGAQILIAGTKVHTVFNAGTTNVLVVGYGSNLNEIFDASTSGSSVTEDTTGWYESAAALALNFTEDKELMIKFTQTGTAATTGKATVTVVYVETDFYG